MCFRTIGDLTEEQRLYTQHLLFCHVQIFSAHLVQWPSVDQPEVLLFNSLYVYSRALDQELTVFSGASESIQFGASTGTAMLILTHTHHNTPPLLMPSHTNPQPTPFGHSLFALCP